MNKAYSSRDIEIVTPVQAVRKQPALFLGGIPYPALFNYAIAPIHFLFARGVTQFEIELNDDTMVVRSIGEIDIHMNNDGRIVPFQERAILSKTVNLKEQRTWLNMTWVNGCSHYLSVSVGRVGGRSEWMFEKGELVSEVQDPTQASTKNMVTLRYQPDQSVFGTKFFPVEMLISHLRLFAHLRKDISLTLVHGDRRENFPRANRLMDLFHSIAMPFQLLHQPLQFGKHVDGIELDLIVSHHSWYPDQIVSFLNDKRSYDGGAHVDGFRAALRDLYHEFDIRAAERQLPTSVALLSVRYDERDYNTTADGSNVYDLVHAIVFAELRECFRQREHILSILRTGSTFVPLDTYVV